MDLKFTILLGWVTDVFFILWVGPGGGKKNFSKIGAGGWK
jgi:hypothetical protein